MGLRRLQRPSFWLSTPEYTSPGYANQFQEFFDLRPPPQEYAPQAEMESLAVALEEETTRHIRQKEARATDLFREATSEECEDRAGKLGQVILLLSGVRDLDRECYIPLLLMSHAALERQQMSVAAKTLMEAVTRHPGLFKEQLDLRSYFGDPERLEDQALRYVRASDFNEESLETHILSAYCAWILGDMRRVREGLEKAEALTKGEPKHRRIRAMRAALEAGMR